MVTGFDASVWEGVAPPPGAPVEEELLWETLAWFLERAVPVAEEAGVKLALHPDDPPLSPVRGIGRIIRSLEAYDRVFALQPSAANGMTLCQGNFALMTDDLPAAIRHFGDAGRIHFVHFRDVRGTPERFVETFVDEGPTDMAACIRAYLAAGVDAPLRTDHSPSLERRHDARAGLSHPGAPARDRLRPGPARRLQAVTGFSLSSGFRPGSHTGDSGSRVNSHDLRLTGIYPSRGRPIPRKSAENSGVARAPVSPLEWAGSNWMCGLRPTPFGRMTHEMDR